MSFDKENTGYADRIARKKAKANAGKMPALPGINKPIKMVIMYFLMALPFRVLHRGNKLPGFAHEARFKASCTNFYTEGLSTNIYPYVVKVNEPTSARVTV